jgi:xanthine dehydrogenase small subunit
LALGAELILTKDGALFRTLPLHKFYITYKTLAMLPGELISEIRIPLPGKDCLMNYEKVSKRTHLDIASVNSTCYIEQENGCITLVRISAGGVGPIPLFLQATSEFLTGKSVTHEIVTDAIAIAQSEISPISDARGTARYKTLLLGQLLKAHFLTLFPESVALEEVL